MVFATADLCKNLRHLEIYTRPGDVGCLNYAVGPVADDIENLVLRLTPETTNYDFETSYSSIDLISCECDMCRHPEYPYLKHLTVDDWLLFRDAEQMRKVGLWRRLPESLESLVLVERWRPPPPSHSSSLPGGPEAQNKSAEDHLFDVTVALRDLAWECLGFLPQLRRLVFDRTPERAKWERTSADEDFKQQYPGIRSDFAEVGIEFRVLYSAAKAQSFYAASSELPLAGGGEA